MTSYTDTPPAYGEPARTESEPVARTEGDNIPDDFKYSTNVASCELLVRNMFLRKVYSLLTVQIFGTILVGSIIRFNAPLQAWCLNNLWLYFVSIVSAIGFMITAYIKAKSYPVNLICLAGFTLSEAYGVGLVCSMVESTVVVQALLLTFVIFIGLTLFSFQTKYDFTQWQGVLSIGLWILIGVGFVSLFIPMSSKIDLVYSSLGAIIFSIYIIVDTQIIMKTAFLDDEIVSTIKLYLDILNLFLFILRILQSRNDS